MEFYTPSKFKRPVRLCEKTREFAAASLGHTYGEDTRKTPHVTVPHIEGFENLTDLQRYDTAVRAIAENAPLRVCPGELISGAATLGDAIDHLVPVRFEDDPDFYLPGISHLTVDYGEVLSIGMNGVEEKIKNSPARFGSERNKAFLKSCAETIESMRIWHKRYTEKLSRLSGYEENVKILSKVPFSPAKNFREALQSIWVCFAFLRLTGCWPGFGRIDVILGDFLRRDLESGQITADEARELLAHFFIKGCEWITGMPTVSGDAQHYQNIVLSGIDADGRDVTNEVTYLVLDIIEETGISDFPVTVRINKNTDERLLRRVSEVIRLGGGTVAVYNEDLVLESLEDMGYEKSEARRFANDGCWEVQIPGKTFFEYAPFDSLRVLQHVTLNDFENADFDSYDSLFAKFREDLSAQAEEIYKWCVLKKLEDDKITFKNTYPCTSVSLFEHDCIERGLSYLEGGAVYNVLSPHIGGAPDAANSLYAIKKAVFEDKLVSFKDLMEILRNNWEGHEELRGKILDGYTYFGNGNEEADSVAADVLDCFADICRKFDKATPIRFVSGVSTFGRQIEWSRSRLATPFGRKKGEVLSGNFSPTPGTDENGAAAVIRSCCAADLRRQHTGAALDISFIPSSLDSENAVKAISGLIKAFVALGGFFMQIDTTDKELLRAAQRHPENYQNLSVRVSGWNARFVTLSREWQDMIIERT